MNTDPEPHNAPVRIPFSMPDAAIERIYDNARRSFRRHMGNVRGQQVMQADAIEYHIINATLDELRDTIDQYAPVPAAVPSTTEETIRTATQYAHNLVVSLHRDHYQDNNSFEPFDDLLGLLSQIDNMICGWKEPAAVPQSSVADICHAYESGVGHRGRPTANVNPYPLGSNEYAAYALGASGTKHNAPVPAQDVARDAERYRVLRKMNWNNAPMDRPSGARLDALLDVMISVKGEAK